MSHAHEHPTVPRGALIGAALLIGVSIALAAGARLTGIGQTQLMQSPPVASRSLHFKDRPDGAITVHEAGSGEEVARVEPETGGFIRGVMRGMARERKLRGVGAGPPFKLILTAENRFLLVDPATGREVHLEAFGPTNGRAFARLLTAGRSER